MKHIVFILGCCSSNSRCCSTHAIVAGRSRMPKPHRSESIRRFGIQQLDKLRSRLTGLTIEPPTRVQWSAAGENVGAIDLSIEERCQ